MKKVLFATSALVATAGVAAADVTVSGFGRFGILYNDAATDNTEFTSRLRFEFTGTAESDNGLSFGGQIRTQTNGNGDSGTTFNSPRFWVSTGGLTVSVGQVLGALDAIPGTYTGTVGLTGLGFANVAHNYGMSTYESGAVGTQGMDVIYSTGGFGIHFTHEFDDGFATGSPVGVTEARNSLAGSYSTGNFTFGIGFQDATAGTSTGDVTTKWAASAGGTFGAADVAFTIAQNAVGTGSGTDDKMKYGIGANFQVGSSTFIRGYINHDEALNNGSGGQNYGVGFQHRLGGGTFIEGGLVQLGQATASGADTRADLGLRFSF